jgi:putative spermidine/putrescine transport system substrate-binding protein
MPRNSWIAIEIPKRSLVRSVAIALLVLLISWLTACGRSAPVLSDCHPSSSLIYQQLENEGAILNLYWPAGGTIKTWIANFLVPNYKSYIQTHYCIDMQVNILSTGGGDEIFFQKLAAYEQAHANGSDDFDIDVVRTVPSVNLVRAGEKGWMKFILPDVAQQFPNLFPNLQNVNPSGLKSFTTDQGKTYAIAVYQPTLSFFYNQHYVSQPPKSLNDLAQWVHKNPLRFTYEDPRSANGIGSGVMFMLMVMKSSCAANVDQLKPCPHGFEFLRDLQEHIYPQPVETAQMIELMKRGDIWLMAFWNDFGQSVATDQQITFMKSYFLTDPAPIRNTPLAVPRSAAHPLAGLLFVNYALSNEMQLQLALSNRQIPASNSNNVWKKIADQDASKRTYGDSMVAIRDRTFLTFNTPSNLQKIQSMIEDFSEQVLQK